VHTPSSLSIKDHTRVAEIAAGTLFRSQIQGWPGRCGHALAGVHTWRTCCCIAALICTKTTADVAIYMFHTTILKNR
jgi:hypothetical protein